MNKLIKINVENLQIDLFLVIYYGLNNSFLGEFESKINLIQVYFNSITIKEPFILYFILFFLSKTYNQSNISSKIVDYMNVLDKQTLLKICNSIASDFINLDENYSDDLSRIVFSLFYKYFEKASSEEKFNFFYEGIFFELISSLSVILNDNIIKASKDFINFLKGETHIFVYLEDEDNFCTLCELFTLYKISNIHDLGLYREILNLVISILKKDLFVDIPIDINTIYNHFLNELEFINDKLSKVENKQIYFEISDDIINIISMLCNGISNFNDLYIILEHNGFVDYFIKNLSNLSEFISNTGYSNLLKSTTIINQSNNINEYFINKTFNFIVDKFVNLLIIYEKVISLIEEDECFADENNSPNNSQNNYQANRESHEYHIRSSVFNKSIELNCFKIVENLKKALNSIIKVAVLSDEDEDQIKTNGIPRLLSNIDEVVENDLDNDSCDEKYNHFRNRKFTMGNKKALCKLISCIFNSLTKSVSIKSSSIQCSSLITKDWLNILEDNLRKTMIFQETLEGMSFLKITLADISIQRQEEEIENHDSIHNLSTKRKRLTLSINDKDINIKSAIEKINTRIDQALNNKNLEIKTKDYSKLLNYLNTNYLVDSKLINDELNLKKIFLIATEAFEILIINNNKSYSNYIQQSNLKKNSATSSNLPFKDDKCRKTCFFNTDNKLRISKMSTINTNQTRFKSIIKNSSDHILGEIQSNQINFEENSMKFFDVASSLLCSLKLFSNISKYNLDKLKFIFDFIVYILDTFLSTSPEKFNLDVETLNQFKKDCLIEIISILINFILSDEVKAKKIIDSLELIKIIELNSMFIYESYNLRSTLTLLLHKLIKEKQFRLHEDQIINLIVKILNIHSSDMQIISIILHILNELKSEKSIVQLLVDKRFIVQLNALISKTTTAYNYFSYILSLFDELLLYKQFCLDLIEEPAYLKNLLRLFDIQDKESERKLISLIIKGLKVCDKFSQLFSSNDFYADVIKQLISSSLKRQDTSMSKNILEILILIGIPLSKTTNNNSTKQSETESENEKSFISKSSFVEGTVQFIKSGFGFSNVGQNQSIASKQNSTLTINQNRYNPINLFNQQTFINILTIYKVNIKSTEVVILVLKVLDLLTQFQFFAYFNNFSLLKEVISMTYSNHSDNFFIINQITLILQNIFIQHSSNEEKEELLKIIFSQIELYFQRKDILLFLLDSLSYVIKFYSENIKDYFNLTIQCFTHKLSDEIIISVTSLLYKVIKHKNSITDKDQVLELITLFYEKVEKTTNKDILINFIKFMSIVSQYSFLTKEIITNYFLFICNKIKEFNLSGNYNSLAGLELISKHYFEDKNLENEEICNILIKLFYKIIETEFPSKLKESEELAQIIFNISIKSSIVKNILIDKKFNLWLKQSLEQGVFDSYNSIAYIIKGIIYNLKEQKKENFNIQQKNAGLKNMKLNVKLIEIKPDQKEFLNEPRSARM